MKMEKVSVPNKELMDRFHEMLQREDSLGYVYGLAKESERMLRATLEGGGSMNDLVRRVKEAVLKSNLRFSSKPVLIGGQAMEYYDIRKSGKDIDFVITDQDYQHLAEKNPEKRKDLYGDLGVTIDEFEIWRSIAHLDYDFFKKEAVDEGDILVISIDRLLWTRVCAMDVEKYMNDLKLIKEYYYKKYTNQQYHKEAMLHEHSYKKMKGAVFGGKYEDE